MDLQEHREIAVLAAKIRRNVLEMLSHCGYGHVGGSLSIADLLAVLYGKHLRHDPANPQWDDRDRLVLSKGHAGPALYSVLAERGFFDRDMLFTLNQGGTQLPSHPDRLRTPGVDMTTGSLGQGTSTAAGIATGLRLNGSDRYVYLIVGDGELNEGQCWEAFSYLASYAMNNCIVFIDDNKKQLDGFTADVIRPFDIAEKMRSFGFHTETVKGGDIDAIDAAITTAKQVTDQAVCIVLDSIKGQGVEYFETLFDNHSVKFNNDEINQATADAIDTLNAIIEKESADATV